LTDNKSYGNLGPHLRVDSQIAANAYTLPAAQKVETELSDPETFTGKVASALFGADSERFQNALASFQSRYLKAAEDQDLAPLMKGPGGHGGPPTGIHYPGKAHANPDERP
jgi:hypothetical protein